MGMEAEGRMPQGGKGVVCTSLGGGVMGLGLNPMVTGLVIRPVCGLGRTVQAAR